ncbi:uncharacterized protein [Rutidosis leptorrhynchoides]|uniref:uncharacterized protein n=1 Tax=Rutidosis leptorrhynchoides TaxID=125765 RepID=UPI003A9939FF
MGKIGDGRDTLFWNDIWVGDTRLKDKFPRLFPLELDQNATVKDRVTFDNGSWSFSWEWSRMLSGRLCGELDGLIRQVQQISGLVNGGSSWVCKLDDSGVYKTKAMTKRIDDIILADHGFDISTMRNRMIPQKVWLFIWRALRQRIPVRIELEKRGVDLDSVLCPLCNDYPESVEHSIFQCKHAVEVWIRIFNWLGISFSGNASLSELFSEDGGIGSSKLISLVWQATKWVSGYFIWKNRNQKVFHQDSWAAPKIVKFNRLCPVLFVFVSSL